MNIPQTCYCVPVRPLSSSAYELIWIHASVARIDYVDATEHRLDSRLSQQYSGVNDFVVSILLLMQSQWRRIAQQQKLII